jgi:hypothetical protein
MDGSKCMIAQGKTITITRTWEISGGFGIESARMKITRNQIQTQTGKMMLKWSFKRVTMKGKA